MSFTCHHEGDAARTLTGKILSDHAEQQSLPILSTKNNVSMTIDEIQCLNELKKRIKDDNFMDESGIASDDELLLAFVRGKGCNLENVFKTLQNHVHVKAKYSTIFQNISPMKFQYLLDTPRLWGFLRHPDPRGCRVGVGTCAVFNPRIHNVDDLIQVIVMEGMDLVRSEAATQNGLVLIVDASGFGIRHAKEFSMARLNLFLNIFLNAYPIKYKGFHILNNSYLFDTILAIVKQLTPKKLRERIHFHGSDMKSLHEHVPPQILPKSLGGFLCEDVAYDTDMEQRIIRQTL